MAITDYERESSFILYDSHRDGDNPVDLSIRFLFMLLITVLIAWASWVKPRGALLNAGGSRVWRVLGSF